MLTALLTVVLPVLLILGFGALVGNRLALDNLTINRLNLYLLTPALALNSLLHLEVKAGSLTLLVLAYFVLSAVGVLLGYLAAFRQPSTTRRAVMASVAIGNNGNYGLPVALFALGQAGFDQALVIYLSSVLLTFTAGPLIFGGGGGIGPTLRGVFKLPVVWCIALALTMRGLHLQLPTGLDRGLGLLSGATLPMVLLSLGVQLGTGGRPKLSFPVWLASGLRVLVMPVLGLLIGYFIGLRGLHLQGLVLSSAMPTAVNAFVLSKEYRADSGTVASVVVVTTVLSILGVALVVPLLGRLP
ncbi:AEC family transporter [Deinococcus psychrotolerans]|uniref:AEC family transporter n=1 Tax=Deinococcus psychrotolerans TaxID=2489213 RepID=A0A3G8YDZ0_9DEIO|nr:AEC family transporter [Deinococcus psychrotolerans]AZI43532.1 AEC family transporter [Deinococcus psychrotolerans]